MSFLYLKQAKGADVFLTMGHSSSHRRKKLEKNFIAFSALLVLDIKVFIKGL